MAEDATCCNCWIVSFHFAFFVCLLWFVFSFFWHSLFTNWQLPWLAMALNNSMTRPIAWQFICFDCIVHHEYQCVLNSYSYRIWQMPWKIIIDISIKKNVFAIYSEWSNVMDEFERREKKMGIDGNICCWSCSSIRSDHTFPRLSINSCVTKNRIGHGSGR